MPRIRAFRSLYSIFVRHIIDPTNTEFEQLRLCGRENIYDQMRLFSMICVIIMTII